MFTKYIVLDNGVSIDLFSGENWQRIIRDVVWPLVALIIVFAFYHEIRCILHDMPGLIRRSYVRYGTYEKEASKDAKVIPYDDTADAETEQEGDKQSFAGKLASSEGSQNNAANQEETPAKKNCNSDEKSNASSIESVLKYLGVRKQLCTILASEYGVPAKTHKMIDNSKNAFPIVLENETSTIGCHITIMATQSILTKAFKAVLLDYANFSQGCKNRFIFLECVVSDETQNVRNWLYGFASKMPFPVKLRFFKLEEGILKEYL